MIEKLACKLGRNDEQPNIELAILLCENENTEDIREIIEGLKGKDKAIASDCIKVIYEIGSRKPELISEFAEDFIGLLLSKNNRLAWGSMTALATITELNPKAVYDQFDTIKKAYENGSVITVDNSITVFAKLCKADKSYRTIVFPILMEHLKSCGPREVLRHAERMELCIDNSCITEFFTILDKRKNELTPPQIARTEKIKKRLCKESKPNAH